jgi:hypothetical protein
VTTQINPPALYVLPLAGALMQLKKGFRTNGGKKQDIFFLKVVLLIFNNIISLIFNISNPK